MKSKFEKLKTKEIISNDFVGGRRASNYSNSPSPGGYTDTGINVNKYNGTGQFDIIAATNPASNIGVDVYKTDTGADSYFNQYYTNYQ
jgi:hypothetical protein